MDSMSALEQASDNLPITVNVTVDDKAVKEAVITHLALEVCLHLCQQFPTTSFKVIANPPTFVKITKKYKRRASTLP